MPQPAHSERVPKEMQDTFAAVTAMTNRFCEEYLTKEYAQLARYAAAALGRKRPSPLNYGHLASWACGILHAVATVNILFDSKREPHVSVSQICDAFGVSKSVCAGKAKTVRDTLHMRQFDPHWMAPSTLDDHPVAWMISLNGLHVDARYLPREVQALAVAKGILPRMPPAPE